MVMQLFIKPIDAIVNSFVVDYYNELVKKNKNSTDSGIDLCLPKDIIIPKNSYGVKIPLGVSCEVKFSDNSIHGYYLYPRSSTGSKTPLRLSNGTGIIETLV